MTGRRQQSLFESERLGFDRAIELTAESLATYGPAHDHWAVAWSGGKDSTATLTVLVWLMQEGRIPAPRSLTVLYADTRQELPPLYAAALGVMERLEDMGIAFEVCRAPIDWRFLVYIFGRGVPPPNNNTLRWCTRQIKVDPMAESLERLIDSAGGSVLTITGVRLGESAARDQRISLSCSRDGAECGQGWYQSVLPNAKGVRGRIATLASLLHWRVCHVWDWLQWFAPAKDYGAWPTRIIADAYGGDEAAHLRGPHRCS